MSPTRDARTVVAIRVLRAMAAALSALELEVDRLFALIAEGVAGVTAAFLDSDRESARVLRANEQQIDGVFRTAEAIDMGLVARFFERLGDHAVNVCRRFAAADSGR